MRILLQKANISHYFSNTYYVSSIMLQFLSDICMDYYTHAVYGIIATAQPAIRHPSHPQDKVVLVS